MAASITIAEIAKLCGVQPRMVNRWIDCGELAAVRIDHQHVRVRSSDLEALVVAGTTARTAEAPDDANHLRGAEPGLRLERAPGPCADREETHVSIDDGEETRVSIDDDEETRVSIDDGEETPVSITDREETPGSITAGEEIPLWIAIAHSEEARLSIVGNDETLLSIADGEDISLIGRVFFRPDGRGRWTMFVVWALVCIVAVLASLELGSLLH